MGLCSLPVGCLAWSDPILESTGSLVGLMVNSKRVYANTHLPGRLRPVPLSLHQVTVNPGLCRKPLNTHRQAWLSLLWGHCFFPLGPGAQRFCLCPPKVSVSSVLWKFCNQILLSFKISFLGYSQFLCLIPRLGSLMWGLESLQKCENFSDIFILQLVSHSPGGCEILFQHDYISPTILLWLLLCH